MGQNSKVVHCPARLSDTVELQLIIQVVIRETTVRISRGCSDSTPFFRCFDPYPVRFYPYLVHVVHHRTGKKVDFCKHGPMDRNSVKNCATVTLMRQKLDNTIFRCGSQLAWEATRWTGYASAIWSFRLANHIVGSYSFNIADCYSLYTIIFACRPVQVMNKWKYRVNFPYTTLCNSFSVFDWLHENSLVRTLAICKYITATFLLRRKT